MQNYWNLFLVLPKSGRVKLCKKEARRLILLCWEHINKWRSLRIRMQTHIKHFSWAILENKPQLYAERMRLQESCSPVSRQSFKLELSPSLSLTLLCACEDRNVYSKKSFHRDLLLAKLVPKFSCSSYSESLVRFRQTLFWNYFAGCNWKSC